MTLVMRGYRYYYTVVSYDPQQQVVDGPRQRGGLDLRDETHKYYSGPCAVSEWSGVFGGGGGRET